MNRRAFLIASLGLTMRASAAPTIRLETLREWQSASPRERDVVWRESVRRIREMDASLHAWVQINPVEPVKAGPLSGIPFGVKDIIETKGLVTEYGSPAYKGRIGSEDAAIVTALRERGAVLMGKTQTAAFAWRAPPPTRNPRNPAHTPGGSSSGSAAAVAAGMVPFAIGTQTSGSVIRPASFCGIAGFKTSLGLLPMEGVFPFAPSFDTLGFFTTTAADMAALWAVLQGPLSSTKEVTIAVVEPLPEVDASMKRLFGATVARLKVAGVSIRSVDIAPMLPRLHTAQRIVGAYEAARLHENRYREQGELLGPFATVIRDGLKLQRPEYDAAIAFITECRRQISVLCKETPIILSPAAPGAAPLGLESTGDSRLNSPWSAMGFPAMTIPMPGSTGLPVGLQLTADRGQDARLIRTGVQLEELLKK